MECQVLNIEISSRSGAVLLGGEVQQLSDTSDMEGSMWVNWDQTITVKLIHAVAIQILQYLHK